MSKPKETVVLPSINEESGRLPSSVNKTQVNLSRNNPDFVTKHNVKKITCWFKTWHQWQKRIFICRVIEHCLKQHLEFLATSLEPVLHFDFSSSLTPHLQSLHLDGVATFQVHRTIMQSVINPQVLEAADSLSYLHSMPSTLRTATTNVSNESVMSNNSHSHSGSLLKVASSKSSRKLTLPTSVSHISVSGASTLTVSDRSVRSIHSETSKSQRSGLSSQYTDLSDSKNSRTKEREVILPVLPLTHTKHAQELSSCNATSFEDVVALRRRRFSSVPDFKSTTDLLKGIREKRVLKPNSNKMVRHHRKAKTVIGTCSISLRNAKEENRQVEHYKAQLALISSWLEKWTPSQKSFLLLEVVKLCNKELLGYFVQCLYQRIQDEVSMNTLPDAIILRIFSYLNPQNLSKCAQVCGRWNRLSSDGGLWRHHSKVLGESEGVGDLASAVETATTTHHHGVSNVPSNDSQGGSEVVGATARVDWKRAYWELNKVMSRIKGLVVKAAKAAEEKERLDQLKSTPPPTSSAVRGNLSLKEMLQILRARSQTPGGSSTTQELLRSAPESAATMRRRLRAERKAAMESVLREEEDGSGKYQHRRPNDRRGSSSMSPLFGSITGKWPQTPSSLAKPLMDGITESTDGHRRLKEWSRKVDVIQLIEEALDKRPAIPYLPDANGIHCLILAGCLMSGETPKPGRVQPIPRLRRLKLQHHYSVLCLQFDQKKIIMGTDEREILIHDIRSGRHVHTLVGHKGSIQCLQFDDNKVVSGSWDTSLMVWDIVHFTPIKELKGHVDCVSCLQFDEEKLVSGSHDRSLRVWSTSSWNCVAVIGSAHEDPVTCVRMNEHCIASGSTDMCVKLWSLTGYHSLATLQHSAPLTSLCLSNLLLTSSASDGSVNLWNLCTISNSNNSEDGERLMQWSVPGGAYFTDMAIGGSRLYGAASDGVVYEWDISTGNCARSLTGHSRALTCIHVDCNKLLVTASQDRSVCLWYSKKAIAKEDGEEQQENENFDELPIRVMTQLDMD